MPATTEDFVHMLATEDVRLVVQLETFLNGNLKIKFAPLIKRTSECFKKKIVDTYDFTYILQYIPSIWNFEYV